MMPIEWLPWVILLSIAVIACPLSYVLHKQADMTEKWKKLALDTEEKYSKALLKQEDEWAKHFEKSARKIRDMKAELEELRGRVREHHR